MISLKDPALLKKTVQYFRDRYRIPGISLCLTDSYGEDYIMAAGVRNLLQDTLLDPYDHQRVGSLLNIVTSVVILKLQEEGILSLEQTVESILPGILKEGSRISVRQLLQHRSGLKDYLWMDVAGTKCIEHAVSSPRDFFSSRSLVRLVANHNLEFQPGTLFKYSNTNFLLLGLIVEESSGKKFKDAVYQWITQPLQLDRTYFPSTNDLRLPFATGHSKATPDLTDLSDDITYITDLNVSIMGTSGALVSNPAEIQTFMKALFGGSLLSQESMKQMLIFHETDDSERFYGLGLYKYTFENEIAAYGHHSGIHGYESVTLYYPDDEIFATVIVNQTPVGVVSLAHQLFVNR
ncbi:serine hydrolase [Rossellomorea vietnamensis]|uniref:Beta-lactamase family protein n=1 Tax=Rossellomorea vietnamensis TaxID=218284 RepID=A0ACD4C9Y5_9BACI|nr:serine hydrolase domain-containing protein [Rossellomorea vietnamensis]UXH45116.1 beta-lactamase family protein [Rossellomorea vietnamensis]WQI96474.1 serine hydrolase domain-containing protein [Rossellomorea vietnamensis]